MCFGDLMLLITVSASPNDSVGEEERRKCVDVSKEGQLPEPSAEVHLTRNLKRAESTSHCPCGTSDAIAFHSTMHHIVGEVSENRKI
jgi:hypothetical protein